jgi:hypothetical protein
MAYDPDQSVIEIDDDDHAAETLFEIKEAKPRQIVSFYKFNKITITKNSKKKKRYFA